jgi:hypothetical protein
LGLAGLETFFVVGFAAGIVLVSQIPTVALAKRVAALEKGSSRKDTHEA